MRRVFITGGTGFFGKSMLAYRLRHPDLFQEEWTVLSRSPERFCRENPQFANLPFVRFVSGDIRDFPFPNERFDAIVHAATPTTEALPDDQLLSVICDGTRRVIEFAQSRSCRRALYVGSGAVYGPLEGPAREEAPCRPETVYGRGKLEAEKLFFDSGLEVSVARCFAFVGPHLDRRAHFAIGNFIQDCLDGRDVVIAGDGLPKRSYLYADDLVEWLWTLLAVGRPGCVYNVGSPHGLSILELAETVRSALGSANGIRVCGTPSGVRPSVYVPDVSRVRAEFGLLVKTPLAEAIRLSAGGDMSLRGVAK